MRSLILALSVLYFGISCNSNGVVQDPSDILLAQVGQNKLYYSQLDGMVTEEMTSQDSFLMTNAYVERWTREQVLLIEAERSLPSDIDVDALVEDYRRSLLRLNYEELILKTKLDSLITDAELEAFYEKNKDQYQLEKPILRCLILVSLPLNMQRLTY